MVQITQGKVTESVCAAEVMDVGTTFFRCWTIGSAALRNFTILLVCCTMGPKLTFYTDLKIPGNECLNLASVEVYKISPIGHWF